MTPDEYCQEKAANSGSSFYYSFLFLEPEQRQAITALYAFCREVDDIVDECSDPNLARIKLQWWRQDVARVFDGTPEHPINKALLAAVANYNLPLEHFQDIIDGMEMDLDYHSYPTFKDLMLYCHRVAGVVGLMSAEIFGYNNRATLKYANELGLAFQLTNIIRDIGEDARRGRIYIPEDEMARYQISREDILYQQDKKNLTSLIKFQIERAYNYYDRAFALLPEEDRYAQRSGIIMASIYRTVLDEIKRDGYQVLQHRTSLTPLRKFWIAWRTARREKRRHKKLRQ
jgi:phytoene synthase